MFNKNFRLVKKRDIDKVFKQGSYSAAGFLYLNVLPNRLDNYRAVVIVGKKSGLKAVGRNLLKRCGREALRYCLSEARNVIVPSRSEDPSTRKYARSGNINN